MAKKKAAAPKKAKAVKRPSVSETLRAAIAQAKDGGRTLSDIARAAAVEYSIVHRFFNSGADIGVSKIDALADSLDLELRPR